MILRALELYCGIGGFSAAVAGTNVRVVGALDRNEEALSVYRLNFPDHQARRLDLETLTQEQLLSYQADLWWLSPPCRPYGAATTGRELSDPRIASLVCLMDLLQEFPRGELPRHLVLESISGFSVSQSRDRLLQVLHTRGYAVTETELCPTLLGVPNRRPRYYLLASLEGLNPLSLPAQKPLHPLGPYLGLGDGSILSSDLHVYSLESSKATPPSRVVQPERQGAYTACFTPTYGQCADAHQSYLRWGEGVRHFAPEEIARLLHFPEPFRFPDPLPLSRRWQLIGNSPSAASVRQVLQAFPSVGRR